MSGGGARPSTVGWRQALDRPAGPDPAAVARARRRSHRRSHARPHRWSGTGGLAVLLALLLQEADDGDARADQHEQPEAEERPRPPAQPVAAAAAVLGDGVELGRRRRTSAARSPSSRCCSPFDDSTLPGKVTWMRTTALANGCWGLMFRR